MTPCGMNTLRLDMQFGTGPGTGNGYIEGTELDGFLKEFVSSANTSDLGPEVRCKIRIIASVLPYGWYAPTGGQ